MTNTITERKSCTMRDLTGLVGTLDALTLEASDWTVLRRQIDKAMDANKKTHHSRNDRLALVQQVASNPQHWGQE